MKFLLRALAMASLILPLWLAIVETLIRAEAAITSNRNSTSTRVARISLESKVLDLGEKFNDETLQLLNQPAHESARSTNGTGRKKGTRKPDRGGRRLSNIWSMFLPGSNNEDYEDAMGEESPDNNASSEAKDLKNTTAVEPMAHRKESSNSPLALDTDHHEEKLVAKYARQPANNRLDTQVPVESSFKRNSMAVNNNSAASLSSLPLMASASSTSGSILDSAQQHQADINDIMSNIMNSMSSLSASSKSSPQRVVPSSIRASAGADSIEREDDSTSANNTGKEGDQFERWLNKIRFRESERGGVFISNSTVAGSNNRKWHEPLNGATKLGEQPPLRSSPGRVSFSSEARKQETKTSVHHTGTKSTGASKAPVHQFARLRQSPASQQVAATGKLVSAAGFNQPYAQASTATIEINAEDNSTAINKQLAASSVITGNLTEVGSPEQSLLQSQDEILKQVTNAINFEQQQLNSRRANENTKSSSSSQELDSTPSSATAANQDEDSQLDSFKLFRVGTNLNELIDGSDRATASKPPAASSNRTNNSPSSRIVAALADTAGESSGQNKSTGNDTETTTKARGNPESQQPGSQLEKQLSSDQPMWLQHKLHLKNNHLLAANNFSKSLGGLGFLEAAGEASKLDKSQLDQLRELVEKHERTKNELKSSQESMYQFLKQFMSADASGKLLAGSQSTASLINNLTGFVVGGQRTQAAAQAQLAGWTPMTLAQQEPLAHIVDRFQGGRLRRPGGVRISQLKDNIGQQADDVLDKENYLDDLSGFYKEFQQDPNSNQRQPSDTMHAITSYGGGKGSVNDDEAIQLELAAHQLMHAKNPIVRPRFRVDPKPQLSQQKLVTLAESMLEDAKQGGGGKLPSKHYSIGRIRPTNAASNNNFQPNLMQIKEKDNQQQQQEIPNQHTEESLNTQDPMSLQTSKLSSEASESLRQKDSSSTALVTRTRYAPQMLAQLNLAGGGPPPAKIQLSLDSVANERPVASAKLRIPNLFSGSGMTGSFVTPDMAHDVGLRAPIVAASLPSNNLPVRFRELSIYRPFGYESHHAIAYQASPAVAALFPGFAQSTRPSILRHMTPFRAIQTQRGLINPIMPAFQVIDNTVRSGNPSSQSADQFQQTASIQSASLPINGASRIRPGFGAHIAGGGSLLKRQSPRTKALANRWASPLGVEPSMMQGRMKIRRNAGDQPWERRNDSTRTVGRNNPRIMMSKHPSHNRGSTMRHTIH